VTHSTSSALHRWNADALRCASMENVVVAEVIENAEVAEGAPDSAPVEVIEELLVEEISIDGMCGVY